MAAGLQLSLGVKNDDGSAPTPECELAAGGDPARPGVPGTAILAPNDFLKTLFFFFFSLGGRTGFLGRSFQSGKFRALPKRGQLQKQAAAPAWGGERRAAPSSAAVLCSWALPGCYLVLGVGCPAGSRLAVTTARQICLFSGWKNASCVSWCWPKASLNL